MSQSQSSQPADSVPLATAQERQVLELLTTLSYRAGELKTYLQSLAQGVSELLQLDWSVVTFCQQGTERILVSTIDLGEDEDQTYDLHGTLTGTVIKNRRSLVVENTVLDPQFGTAPDGYQAYMGVPLQTPAGEVIGTICSFQCQPRSFTEQDVRLAEIFAERAAIAIDNYQLYQQQQQLNQQLQAEIRERQQAQQALVRLAEIGELAAMIVHEVRNPLTTVLMGLTSLQGVDLPVRNQHYLALAIDDAERLQRLLNEILLYAKQQVLQCSELELNEFSHDLLDSLQTIAVIAARNVQLISSLPTARILGDGDKLKQVFTNLVKNACEAIEPGETVTWRIEPSPDNRICVSFHNGGAPIPAEVLAKLGTPFFTTKPSGNGLGLAIVRRIVEAHQGEFSIQSGETGTIVQIQLPLIPAT
jgi:signal transduction histidine kinase